MARPWLRHSLEWRGSQVLGLLFGANGPLCRGWSLLPVDIEAMASCVDSPRSTRLEEIESFSSFQ